jgi:membrane associated rhomboid family serine protease
MACYRHPQRETLLSCSSCERPICTSCATQAAVGLRCPDCAGGRRPATATPPAPAAQLASGLPVATLALVALNVLVFLGELAQGITISGTGGSGIAADWGLRAHEVANGDWWRIVTASFVHAGLLHLAFNMYALWWLGSALERYIGPTRMVAIYFASVLWGSAGALLLSPNALTVGASGGVFGLMAAFLVLERQQRGTFVASGVAGVLVINLVITFALPGISIGGHLGGILGGAAAGLVLSWFGRGHMAYGRITPGVAVGVVAVYAGAIAVCLAAAS